MIDAIVVKGLKKHFEDIEALSGISSDVRYAELFGFLGTNGAGKTTTVNLLIGLARADTERSMGGIPCRYRSTSPSSAYSVLGCLPQASGTSIANGFFNPTASISFDRAAGVRRNTKKNSNLSRLPATDLSSADKPL
jgi:ABC-type Mn2+/Zn2+ transport system ATPase subunit